MSQQSTRLLTAGIVAGPLFLALSLIQAFTRRGFDLRHHPLSLLSLGDQGWIQIATFVASGALFVACAIGMRQVLHPGRSGTWGPVLVGALGIGLIASGVFVTDPGAGFPPGAPAGAPEQMSWHGILHELGFIPFIGMVFGCVVFARRFASIGERRWVGACIATAVGILVVLGWPDLDSLSVRIVIATAILFGFLAALAARLTRGVPTVRAA
jgi:hypothetical protein